MCLCHNHKGDSNQNYFFNKNSDDQHKGFFCFYINLIKKANKKAKAKKISHFGAPG